MEGLRLKGHKIVGPATRNRPTDRLEEKSFHTMLTLERRRAERFRKPFVLILIDVKAVYQAGVAANRLDQ